MTNEIIKCYSFDRMVKEDGKSYLMYFTKEGVSEFRKLTLELNKKYGTIPRYYKHDEDLEDKILGHYYNSDLNTLIIDKKMYDEVYKETKYLFKSKYCRKKAIRVEGPAEADAREQGISYDQYMYNIEIRMRRLVNSESI